MLEEESCVEYKNVYIHRYDFYDSASQKSSTCSQQISAEETNDECTSWSYGSSSRAFVVLWNETFSIMTMELVKWNCLRLLVLYWCEIPGENIGSYHDIVWQWKD